MVGIKTDLISSLRGITISAHNIVDFVCLEKRLVVELDVGQHLDNQTYDMKRTA